MWPLSLILLFATAAQGAQQNAPDLGGEYLGKIPPVQRLRGHDLSRRLSPQDLALRNTCYFIRSYHFRRQDGNAPVPTGMTTCTPALALHQKFISSPPQAQFVPLQMQPASNDSSGTPPESAGKSK